MSSMLQQVRDEIERQAMGPLVTWLLAARYVLYIEDTPTDIEDATRRLQAKGIDTLIAGYGDKVYDLAREYRQRIAIVLVDNVIKDGPSGFETLHGIREYIGAQVPAVGYSFYLSDYADASNLAAEHGETILSFVRKPSEEDSLFNAICWTLWRSMQDSFRRIVEEALRRVAPMFDQVDEIERAEGKVISVAQDFCTVRFGTGTRAVMMRFPTWRIAEAGADIPDRCVEHVVFRSGTQVISDLRPTGQTDRKRLPEEAPEALPQDVEERLRRAEDEDNHEQ